MFIFLVLLCGVVFGFVAGFLTAVLVHDRLNPKGEEIDQNQRSW